MHSMQPSYLNIFIYIPQTFLHIYWVNLKQLYTLGLLEETLMWCFLQQALTWLMLYMEVCEFLKI